MGSSEAHERPSRRFSGVGRLASGVEPRALGALFAALTASVPFLARLSINGRVGPAARLAPWMETLATVGVAGPALAVGALAVTTDDELERVGLTFLAVFGLGAAVVPAATLPAVAATLGGGAVAAARRLPDRTDWHALPAAGLLVGAAVTAAAAMGLGSTALRSVGAHLTLLSAAATPALASHGSRDWAFGGLVGGLLIGVGLGSPFLTGAVALVGGGIVTVSLPVMAVGLCGLVTTLSAAVRARYVTVGCGAALLVVAGVPATLPRLLAAVVGVGLLVEARRGELS